MGRGAQPDIYLRGGRSLRVIIRGVNGNKNNYQPSYLEMSVSRRAEILFHFNH